MIQTEAPVKDVIQEIFLNIWLSRQKLVEIDNPRKWIFRIAYFQSYKWIRQQLVRTEAKHVLQSGANMQPTFIDGEPTAFGETARLIKLAIEQLPPQAKKIYLLSREEDLKIREIADLLKLSTQTVKNSLTRSLHTIQEFLEEHEIYIPAVFLGFLIF